MAALSLWTRPLQAVLPGITPAQAEEKLRHALKEFYLQSRAWRQVLGPLDIQASTSLVTPAPPADSQIVWVRSAWLQEGSIRTHLKTSVTKITETRSDKPTHYYSESPQTLNLWPTPDVNLDDVLFVEVALTMTDAAATAPDLSATHHFEAIQNGALARLYMMPNKPWTDQIAATRYGQLFRRACMELRAVSDAGYLHGDPPWRFPPFA